jgi:NAD(P)-dependent dehydrogenase (short-subunit alcohol dehydrogenase family)
MSTAQQKSVLVIGATGRTGLECIRLFANHPTNPAVHAFCRDVDHLNDKDKDLDTSVVQGFCTSIVQGDALNPKDLERALAETHADVVVLSIGNSDSVRKSYTRTASAHAMVQVLQKPQFEHVHTIVVSSVGAGNSRIIVGGGVGKLISLHLRHVLADHTGQEHAFHSLRDRTTVIRATHLTDEKATGKLACFQDREKPPSTKTDRADLAAWIVEEVCGGTKLVGGRVVNVTGVKEQ